MLNALFRARLAVLGLLIVLAAVACAMFPPAAPVRTIVTLGIAMAAAVAVSFLHLRHAGLAILVAAAPIPGFLVATAAGFPVSPVLSYLPGLACAVFLADEIARAIATGIERKIAAQDALRGSGLTACLAVAAIAMPMAAILPFMKSPETALLTTIASAFSAVLIVPLSASLLPFSENFITRANRLREWRERMLEYFAAITQPRWGMSAAGIAIVFAVLGFFGAQDLRIALGGSLQIAVGAAAALSAFTAVFVATRDWRRALSALLALTIPALIALWGLTQIGVPLDQQSLLLVLQTIGVAAVSIIFIAAEASRYLSDDAASLALLRKGAAAICIFFIAALAEIAQWENAAMIAVQVAILFFGCVSAILFQPAFAVALEMLVPGKAALEARYRVR